MDVGANLVAAFKLEAVKGPVDPRPLYDFHKKDDVDRCILMSDILIGGSSKSHLDFITEPSSPLTSNTSSTPSSPSKTTTPKSTTTPPTPSPNPSSYARFYGHISTALPQDKPGIKRTGYAAFRSPDQAPTLLGRALWDIDPYAYLALRIKSDGRSYFVNVQTEGVEPTDLHQHRLFAKRPGQWETVLVSWNDFVRTNYGFVVEPQTELLRQKVTTVGIGLTDRVEGPFELCIEKMWATNKVEDGQTVLKAENAPSELEPEKGALKTRKGQNIHW